jgi:hypothetical protein
MSDIVYIPTAGREDNLVKIVPRWLGQNFTVCLVVAQEDEADMHCLIDEQGWDPCWVPVVARPRQCCGMGAIRRYIVSRAQRAGHTAIVMSDDDCIPVTDNFSELTNVARKGHVLGIGATQPYHDLLAGRKLSQIGGPILCPAGWGQMLFALNVSNAVMLGNYDTKLHTMGEDAEMARMGIARGIPWLVHCDVKWTGLNARFAAGGISTMYATRAERDAAEYECKKIIHSRWPRYVTNTPAKYACQWKKMLDDYIPKWRELSALHGGSLEGYFDAR